MKVHVKGEGDISLSETRDFVAEGGEGRVFARGSTGYKIYHDPSKAIPAGKVQELGAIKHGAVIKPEKLIFKTHKGKATHVGHTFRFVDHTWTLCQLFPRAFRDREGFDHKRAWDLLRKLQEGVAAVHKAGVLIVDLNEMNFLVSQDFQEPYFIDVDSYQTRHFPATAIMPSVRDWQTPIGKFNENSDWFSFAIVSFQLLVGIHPFKGKHPSIKGFEERMKQQISVFDPKVKVPKVCYSFDIIPQVYRDWYEAVFSGKRLPPPGDLHAAIIVTPQVRAIHGTDNYEMKEMAEFDNAIRAVYMHHGRLVVHAGEGVWVDGHRRLDHTEAMVPVFTERHNHPLVFNVTSNALVDAITGKKVDWMFEAKSATAYEGRLYLQGRQAISEATFAETANRVVAGTQKIADVMPHSTKLYQGCAIQSLLGDPWVSLFPRAGFHYQVAVPELKGHKVVQAKYDNQVLMVLAARKGQYHRFVFRFDPSNYKDYDVRTVEDVTPTDLNFVTLDTGVCVCLNEEEQLELFSNRRGSKSVKTIEDPVLGGDMRLVKDGGQVLFFRSNKLYSLKMK